MCTSLAGPTCTMRAPSTRMTCSLVKASDFPSNIRPVRIATRSCVRACGGGSGGGGRSEEHTSELQSQSNLVCRLLLEKKKKPAYETAGKTSITSKLPLLCGQVIVRLLS